MTERTKPARRSGMRKYLPSRLCQPCPRPVQLIALSPMRFMVQRVVAVYPGDLTRRRSGLSPILLPFFASANCGERVKEKEEWRYILQLLQVRSALQVDTIMKKERKNTKKKHQVDASIPAGATPMWRGEKAPRKNRAHEDTVHGFSSNAIPCFRHGRSQDAKGSCQACNWHWTSPRWRRFVSGVLMLTSATKLLAWASEYVPIIYKSKTQDHCCTCGRLSEVYSTFFSFWFFFARFAVSAT